MKVAIAAIGLLVLTGCANNDDAATQTITVSAAASLTDAFTEIGTAFTERNPDTDVRFNFAGSSTLAEQINAGAPVDVFAAASLDSMQSSIEAGSINDPEPFTSNALAIAVPPGNPAGIASLTDLAGADVTVVVCAKQVPCGAAATALFELNSLDVTPVSLEADVRAVLTKVIADEADAGIVYRTDITSAGTDVEGITISDAQNVSTTYPIATTTGAGRDAQAFVDFVMSADGQEILDSWGFTRL